MRESTETSDFSPLSTLVSTFSSLKLFFKKKWKEFKLVFKISAVRNLISAVLDRWINSLKSIPPTPLLLNSGLIFIEIFGARFLKSFRERGGIVVEDITHKFDLGPIAEVDGWICSVRKWFGTSGLATLNLYHHGLTLDQHNLRVALPVSRRLILMKSLNYFPRQSILRRQIIERLRDSDVALGSSNLISLASTNEIERFEHQDWQQIFTSRIKNKIVYIFNYF